MTKRNKILGGLPMYNVSIPEISKEALLLRYSHIKPIVDIDGKKYFIRDYTEEELSSRSYTFNKREDKTEPVDMRMFVPRGNPFECIHAYGYYGVFAASIAEVLAQIEERDVKFVDAFEIIESPKRASDFAKNKIVFDNGYHISKVQLYTSRNNPNVTFM